MYLKSILFDNAFLCQWFVQLCSLNCPYAYCPITDQIIFELFMHSRVRDLSPPWLLFIAENGYGKRVPLNAFRQSSFNRVGLRGYKV